MLGLVAFSKHNFTALNFNKVFLRKWTKISIPFLSNLASSRAPDLFSAADLKNEQQNKSQHDDQNSKSARNAAKKFFLSFSVQNWICTVRTFLFPTAVRLGIKR